METSETSLEILSRVSNTDTNANLDILSCGVVGAGCDGGCVVCLGVVNPGPNSIEDLEGWHATKAIAPSRASDSNDARDDSEVTTSAAAPTSSAAAAPPRASIITELVFGAAPDDSSDDEALDALP